MKNNAQKEMDKLIEKLDNVPTLLIHACCAPCSSYVLEYLSQYFHIIIISSVPSKEPRLRRGSFVYFAVDYFLDFFFVAGAGFNNRYAQAAAAPPASGATINTHDCLSASPPKSTAGASERAGFTDVPVRLMPMICTNTSARPITMPAIVEFSTFAVTPSIV